MNPSPSPPSRGFFVTGTDTGVGKTYIACLLVEAFKRNGLRVAAMKPVAAGAGADGMNDDVRRLMAAANVQAPPQRVNPYCFTPAIAPHLAAQQAGVDMQMEVIVEAYEQLAAQADVVIVEGAGGFLVPFNGESGMDIIPARLNLPVIMVVGLRLGCLNHALLTAESIRARGLMLAGWIANRIEPGMEAAEENLLTLYGVLRAPCLGEIPWQDGISEGAFSGCRRVLDVSGLES